MAALAVCGSVCDERECEPGKIFEPIDDVSTSRKTVCFTKIMKIL
jgi:hypothetical protein